MKPTIENLQDAYGISRDIFEASDTEAQEVIDLYHNRQYTQEEIEVLEERGQPLETFNIIKMFSNAIEGYMESTVHDVIAKPRYNSNPAASLVLNDAIQYTLEVNEFEMEGSKAVLDGIHTGKMCVQYNIADTGEKDMFGRKLKKLEIEHLPAMRVRIDPMSEKDDMSDARFWSVWKWVDAEEFKAKWGSRKEARAESYSTYGTGDRHTEFEQKYNMRLTGKFKEWHNYLVVRTIMRDGDKTWSVIWHDDMILEKKLIPFETVQSPIRVVTMSRSDKAEHYGLFRDIVESQKAINQAVIQIALLANTKKAFVEDDAVEDVDKFRDEFNRVNEIVVVKDMQGVKIEDLSKDVIAQYTIIDKALERVKSVLGINDSFLGQTFASDSGRKVNLQQNSSKSQMTPIVKRIKFFYKMVGTDTKNFIQQYYTATEVLQIADKVNGNRYAMLNQPLSNPATGEIEFDEEIDPDTGEPLEDEEGRLIMTPLNDAGTSIKFVDAEILIEAVPYNNAAEQNQLLFETFLNGPIGQSVLQTNPAGFYKIAGMQTSEFGTKNSQDIAQVLFETGQLVSQGQMDPSLAQAGGDTQAINGGALGGSNGGGPKSQQLQIPTK